MIRFLAWLSIASAIAGDAHADTTRVSLQSDAQRVSLVELYTSEGCSSCPPAERWLSALQEAPGLWRDFVPVAFHVDYWDYIGWRDRFASTAYSARQRRYAREGGVRVVYTPAVFKDGREWRDWSQTNVPEPRASAPGALTVDLQGKRISVAFRPNGQPPEALVAHLAVLGMGLESRVAAGENSGRKLKHDFVVLGVETKALNKTGDLHTAELRLPQTSVEARQYALIGWISTADRQAPIQAVGGWLPPAAGS